MSSDLERWWKDLPVLTKYLFVGSFGVTLAANFGLLSPYSLVLIWPKVITEFQLWRLVTCFLFHGKLGFPFLIHMLFLYGLRSSISLVHLVPCAQSIWLAGCGMPVLWNLRSSTAAFRITCGCRLSPVPSSWYASPPHAARQHLHQPHAPSVPSCTAAAASF